MFPINGIRFSAPPPVASKVAVPVQSEPADPKDGFTPSGATAPNLLEVSSKSLVIGAGLTLMGVPVPISATIAVGHLVTQAAPETTGKILSNSATLLAVTTAGIMTLGGALAAPVAELGGQFVRHGVGHDFLPGFSE